MRHILDTVTRTVHNRVTDVTQGEHMLRMNVREFRTSFSKIAEPVEILKGTQTIGWFYPGEVSPEFTKTLASESSVEFKADLDQPTTFSSGTKIEGVSLFRPAPKPTRKKGA
jgi:hypothetical protein